MPNPSSITNDDYQSRRIWIKCRHEAATVDPAQLVIDNKNVFNYSPYPFITTFSPSQVTYDLNQQRIYFMYLNLQDRLNPSQVLKFNSTRLFIVDEPVPFTLAIYKLKSSATIGVSNTYVGSSGSEIIAQSPLITPLIKGFVDAKWDNTFALSAFDGSNPNHYFLAILPKGTTNLLAASTTNNASVNFAFPSDSDNYDNLPTSIPELNIGLNSQFYYFNLWYNPN